MSGADAVLVRNALDTLRSYDDPFPTPHPALGVGECLRVRLYGLF